MSLEALYAKGDYQTAIELGESMLQSTEAPHEVGRNRYYLAAAYLEVGQTDRGARLLAEARAIFETVDDQVMLVECMATEAALANMNQEPGALDLALQALARCRELQPVPRPVEVRILNYIASARVARGEWLHAVDAYEEAIERADSVYDMRRRAKLHNDASIAHKELGRLDEATRHAQRALALLETLGDHVGLARLENNLGLILIRRGDLVAARSHLERSLVLCEKTGLEVGRSHVLLSLAEVSLAANQPGVAREFARKALDLAERLDQKQSVAESHLWLGKIAEALAEPNVADSEFELAIAQATRLGLREPLLRCHETYAEILEARGDLRRAFDHLKMMVSLTLA